MGIIITRVQIFDRDKTLKRSIHLANQVNCCCFLNDSGDILVGLPARLVVVRASTYQWLSNSRDGVEAVSIYDGLKGRGSRPSYLIRADTCSLHQLSTAKMPSDM